MKIKLPSNVQIIINELNKCGYEAYAVGGCIRDSLLGREPEDWDITTDATPEQIKGVFRRTVDTGIEHGTVTVLLPPDGTYEVTTYRIDGNYSDGRHPDSVEYSHKLSEDLARRDFTINAMAYNDEHGLVDLYGGEKDLKRGIIKCVGEPEERFSEDALRMLRAVRFAAQLGFEIEPKTLEAITKKSETLSKVSAERIRVELVKTLISDDPKKLSIAVDTGLTKIFLPELNDMMICEQNNPHHYLTVGWHTLESVAVSRPDRIIRIAMLLHDVAKPVCKTTDSDGIDHFKGHPQCGEDMAKDIMRRLKFDNASIKSVSKLVKYHDYRPEIDRKIIRKVISKIGLDAFPALFEVKRADTLAQSDYQREQKLAKINGFEEMYKDILRANECLMIKDLAVNGSDLIAAGVSEGKKVGRILEKLLEYVLEEPTRNTKEYLIGRAVKLNKDMAD